MQRAKHLLAVICLALATFMSLPSFAVVPLNKCFYVQGSIGGDKTLHRDLRHLSPLIDIDEQNHLAGNINLGYKFTPFIAAEVGGTLLNDAALISPLGQTLGNIKTYSFGVALKGFLPLPVPGLELYAKIGVQQMNAITHVRQIKVPVNNEVVTTTTTVNGVTTTTTVVNGFNAFNGDNNHHRRHRDREQFIITHNGIIVDENGHAVEIPITNGNPFDVNLLNGNEILVINADGDGDGDGDHIDFIKFANPEALKFGVHHRRDSQVGIWVGAGAQYYIFPELAVLAEYQYLAGDHDTGAYNFWGVGLTFIVY